jgi:hypothetical protein
MHWELFDVPKRLVRRGRQLVVRVIDGKPATKVLTVSYGRKALIT